MTDHEIEKQLEELVRYECKKRIVEGYHVDDNFFAVVDLPLKPKLDDNNRTREMIRTLYENR